MRYLEIISLLKNSLFRHAVGKLAKSFFYALLCH